MISPDGKDLIFLTWLTGLIMHYVFDVLHHHQIHIHRFNIWHLSHSVRNFEARHHSHQLHTIHFSLWISISELKLISTQNPDQTKDFNCLSCSQTIISLAIFHKEKVLHAVKEKGRRKLVLVSMPIDKQLNLRLFFISEVSPWEMRRHNQWK